MDSAENRRDNTFATEDTGETPRLPHLVKATPRAENHKLRTNNP